MLSMLSGRRRFRRTLVLVLATVAVGVATAEIRSDGANAAGRTVEDSPVIGWANPLASNPGLIAITRGEQLAAKKFGWKVRSIDSNLSTNKQVTDVDTFISLGVKGLISWTLSPGALDAAYKRARDAGIPVVTYATPSKFGNTTIYPQQYFGCTLADDAAKYIAARIPGAKVLVLGPPPVPDLIRYTDCFEKQAKARGLKVLERQDNVKDNAAGAQPLVDNMLTKHPDAQAIWGFNDPSALGAGATVLARGKTVWSGSKKGIIVIGTIGSKEAVDAIKKGAVTVTYDQNGPDIGAAAVQVFASVLKCGKSPSSMEKKVIVPAKRYDLSNIGQWTPPSSRSVKVDTSCK